MNLIGPTYTCPSCGSHFFRSTIVDDVPRVGHCKGHYLEFGMYSGCSFRWLRSQDHMVFEQETTTEKGESQS